MDISTDVTSQNELDLKYGARADVSDADGAPIPANALTLIGTRARQRRRGLAPQREAFQGSILAAHLDHRALNTALRPP